MPLLTAVLCSTIDNQLMLPRQEEGIQFMGTGFSAKLMAEGSFEASFAAVQPMTQVRLGCACSI